MGLDKCFFCGGTWGHCRCPAESEGFEFEGHIIVSPNVSVCDRFFVDPEDYYGEAYTAWRDRINKITNTITLSERDFDRLMEILESDEEPNQALIDAFKNFKEKATD